ncbi:TonB-dependent receptor [Pseudomonas sp. M30-35]|uniref:TonB-dependent siderophore receptor n=1 Tax=Pseudomonas sp. M30-35 TaxID=1981174 RepID=UPI000B3C6793|nr:TonB-dependent receptor [Pseudomonas sp. M30-35]ARU89245.1 TonB-dependent siderophore receptor [Pseudomonas sp. M30-35]
MSLQTVTRHARLLGSALSDPLCVAIHRAVLGSVLAVPLVTVLQAQPAFAESVVAEQEYNIAAGTLESALNSFAATAGVSVSFTPQALQDLSSAGLRGRYTSDQALEKLLMGSRLKVVRQTNGSYSLLPLATDEASNSALELDATYVTGVSLGATTEGTGSYTTGSTSTATGLPLSIRETPQSVSVITRQRMDDQGLTQLNDLVRQTPGLSINQSGNGGSDTSIIYSRGFAVENYQIDGVQSLNSNYTSIIQSNDLALYDRVEIIRGATGLTNGIGTPGATLNMIRKKPTFEPQTSLTVTGGSWNYQRTELDTSGPLTESGNIRGRLVGVYQDNESYIDRFNERKKIFYGVIEADLTPDTLLTVGMDYQSHQADDHARSGLPLYNQDGSLANWSDSDSAGAAWAYSNRTFSSGFATLEQRLNERWKAKLTLNQGRYKYDEVIGYAASGYPDPATGAGMGLWAGRWEAKPVQNSIDLNIAGSFDLFGREHNAVFGYSQQNTDYRTNGYPLWRFADWDNSIDDIYNWDGKNPGKPALPATSRNDYSEAQTAAYGSLRLRATDALSVILGARVSDWENTIKIDYYDPTSTDTDDKRTETGVVTPFAGLVYDLNDNWSLYGSYTSIFKPQSNMTETGNYLDPLEGVGYEVGSKAAFFDDRLNLGLALYQIEQDNLAVAIPGVFAPDGNQAYRAESGTKTRGFEVEVSGELAPDWEASASFSRNIVQDSDGAKLNTNVAQNTAKLFSTYTLRNIGNGLTLGGGVNWQSEIYSDGMGPLGVRFTQDDYALVDVMARYPLTEQLSATLNLNNLLDEEYYTSTSSSYFGTPRNATLGLRMDF